MKVTVIIICAFALSNAFESPLVGVYDYHRRVGIPEAERIRKFEKEVTENGQRIAGGSATTPISVPYQAGLIMTLSLLRSSVCGGSLISDSAVLTAAHCQNDGNNVAQSFTVVLGSNFLFNGGTRIDTRDVVMYPGYNPGIIANDLAVVRFPRVSFSITIQPINLPSGSEINNDFNGFSALVSGYGVERQGDNIALLASVRSVTVPVISVADCQSHFGNVIQNSHICTSGADGRGPCGGDSGGPLIVTTNNRRVLVGISSFFSTSGCDAGFPAGYIRVTSFISWINSIQIQ